MSRWGNSADIYYNATQSQSQCYIKIKDANQLIYHKPETLCLQKHVSLFQSEY